MRMILKEMEKKIILTTNKMIMKQMLKMKMLIVVMM